MLISICPYNLEADEGEAYVETRMREIGIMVSVITSNFIQHTDEDDTEPSHFTHRVIVANIPTLEKFFEAVATFEQFGAVEKVVARQLWQFHTRRVYYNLLVIHCCKNNK